MVLMYHNIDLHACFNTVSLQMLQEQIGILLERGYEFVPMGEYAARLDEAARRKWVCLSFDDGYRSVLSQVLPLAKAHQLPFAVSIPTDFIGRSNSWDSQFGLPSIPILDETEIKGLAAESLVTICSHGCSHTSMASLDKMKAIQELVKSKECLEQLLGKSVEGFCYPFGQAKDLPKGHAVLLEEAGYTYGLSTIWGRKTLPSSQYEIRRIEVCPGDSTETLLSKMEGNLAKWQLRQFARTARWRFFGDSAKRQTGLNTAS